MNNGLPGVRTERTATPRRVLVTDRGVRYIPGGEVIAGSESRDLGNTGDTDVLRAGTLMGKITANGKFAPSIIGVLPSAYSNATDTTSLTVGAANASEIVRRIGATGTITLVGPPTAAGTVAVHSESFASVNESTGVVTLDSAVGANLVAGSFIMAADGSQDPIAIIADNQNTYGIKVTDDDDSDLDVPFAQPVIGGLVDASQIINYPSDTSLIKWLKMAINGLWDNAGTVTYRGSAGLFQFDDDFSAN